MVEPHSNLSLYAECLAAMAASGDAYPCEMFAPVHHGGHDQGYEREAIADNDRSSRALRDRLDRI